MHLGEGREVVIWGLHYPNYRLQRPALTHTPFTFLQRSEQTRNCHVAPDGFWRRTGWEWLRKSGIRFWYLRMFAFRGKRYRSPCCAPAHSSRWHPTGVHRCRSLSDRLRDGGSTAARGDSSLGRVSNMSASDRKEGVEISIFILEKDSGTDSSKDSTNKDSGLILNHV